MHRLKCTFCALALVLEQLPPKPVFRRADIRRIPGGYPADIRRISGLRRSPPDGFSVTSRMRAGASLSPLVGTGRRVATAGLVVPAPARHHSPPCSNQWGERCARDVTENPSGGLLRRADIRRISAGYPPGIRRISALRKSGFAPRIQNPGPKTRFPEGGYPAEIRRISALRMDFP